MRGEHAGEQGRGGPAEAEQVMPSRGSSQLGDGEGEQPEDDAPVPRPHEAVEVGFEPGDEHDIEQPDRPEHDDGGVAFDDVQRVRSEQGAADQEQDQIRNPQEPGHQRSEKNHQCQDGEYENRVFQRKHRRSLQ